MGMTRRDGAPIRQGAGPREGQKVKDQRGVEGSELPGHGPGDHLAAEAEGDFRLLEGISPVIAL